MALSWLDIAKSEDAIDIALNVLEENSELGYFFEEFINNSKELNIEKKQAFKFICLLISTLGGQQIYLPKEESYKSYLTYRLIYSEFNGNNSNELSQKYNVSVQHIGRVVEACRVADREARKVTNGVI